MNTAQSSCLYYQFYFDLPQGSTFLPARDTAVTAGPANQAPCLALLTLAHQPIEAWLVYGC